MPVEDGRTAQPGVPQEAPDEKTAECEVDKMGEDFRELGEELAAETSGRAIVTKAIGSDRAGISRGRAPRAARHDTVPSRVPELLAKSMGSVVDVERPRDPAAPNIQTGEITCRVADPNHAVPIERDSSPYSVELDLHHPSAGDSSREAGHPVPTPEPTPLSPVAALVAKARAYIEGGDVARAFVTASAAILTNATHREVDEIALSDTVGGPLAPVFTGGPIGKVPVVNRSEPEMDTLALDELQWALLRRVDGRTPFAQIFGATKIPPVDALNIAAALLRDGVIRVDGRARA
jgi:hypothetical protein